MGDEVRWFIYGQLIRPRDSPLSRREEAVALSFKLEFPCSNNTAECEAYLTELAMAFEMGVKHLKVIGDSNLVVYQAK